MISIDEARTLILEHTHRTPGVAMPLDKALGLSLAETVTSDVDSPPHDKSLVDGVAVRAADVSQTTVELQVLEQINAGMEPTMPLRPGTASRIMTGAPLPRHADAVVMVEHTSLVGNSSNVRIEGGPIQQGQNIMRRGASFQRGTTVLESGRRLRAIDVGLLSEAGQVEIAVHRPPRVSVLATGDELVPASERPAVAQIRNSNGPMLCAMARSLHCEVHDLGICRDELKTLRDCVRQGLRSDVLILSGGVSAGVLDLVPHVFQQLEIEQVFHKVRLKPGKPLWFGLHRADQHKTLVFGLPGNPVGSLVCFELFVRPVICKMCGVPEGIRETRLARLSCDHRQRGDRPTYHPAVAQSDRDSRLLVTPLAWQGSADQCSVAQANCLAFFPAGDRLYLAGEQVPIHMLDG